MKLIKCYVENFGKISKKEYSFKGGLNCIKEDNGSGKTTLAAFIKAMLYGLSDTKKQSLDENERKRYLPWQGGVCGGSLTFESNGKIYRVERSFSPKAAEDLFAVYDTETGREVKDFDGGLGETLFGINADGFERTVFLSERALSPKSDNRSISAKLSDLVGCDGDIGGMDDAMKVLEEQRKFYQKKGGSGEIADVKSQIDEINRRLDSLCEVERALESSREKMVDLSAKIESLRGDAKGILKEREAALIRVAEANYDKKYAVMKKELEELVSKRRIVDDLFGSEIPSFIDIDEASYKLTEAKNIRQSLDDNGKRQEFLRLCNLFDGKLESGEVEKIRLAISEKQENDARKNDPKYLKAKKIFKERIPTEDELNEIEKLIQVKKEKVSIVAIILAVLSIIAIGVGIFALFPLMIVGTVGIILSILVATLSGAGAKGKRKKQINEFFLSVSGVGVSDGEEAKARLSDMRIHLPYLPAVGIAQENEDPESLIAEFVARFPALVGSDDIKSAEKIIAEFEKYSEMAVAERYLSGERSARLKRAEMLLSEAQDFIARFKTTTSDPISELRRGLNEHNRLTSEIRAKQDEMANLQSLHKIGEGNQQRAENDIALLDARRAENEESVAALSREYAVTERLYRTYSDELDSRDELVMHRTELEEKLAKHKENYETILLTKKYINLAKDRMTVKYLGKTKAGFLKYAELIGGKAEEGFEMDTDFGITKQELGHTRQTEAYSKGTRDLFSLATKLGLIDALYQQEKPFIILDDPFTALDDGKTDKAIKLLKDLAKERQIIYFTCSKSRSV